MTESSSTGLPGKSPETSAEPEMAPSAYYKIHLEKLDSKLKEAGADIKLFSSLQTVWTKQALVITAGTEYPYGTEKAVVLSDNEAELFADPLEKPEGKLNPLLPVGAGALHEIVEEVASKGYFKGDSLNYLKEMLKTSHRFERHKWSSIKPDNMDRTVGRILEKTVSEQAIEKSKKRTPLSAADQIVIDGFDFKRNPLDSEGPHPAMMRVIDISNKLHQLMQGREPEQTKSGLLQSVRSRLPGGKRA